MKLLFVFAKLSISLAKSTAKLHRKLKKKNLNIKANTSRSVVSIPTTPQQSRDCIHFCVMRRWAESERRAAEYHVNQVSGKETTQASLFTQRGDDQNSMGGGVGD